MKHKLLLVLLLFTLTLKQKALAQSPPPGFTSVTVSSGWDEAVGLTFNKAGSHLFVWERPGRVWTLQNGQKSLLLDLSEEVGAWRDFGLLGFALHPDFDTNGYFYLFYTVDRHHLLYYGTPNYNPTANEYFNATINRLTRYQATKTATGYSVDPASRTILLGATPQTGVPVTHLSHGPGSLVFGTDNSLLVSVGDGASYDREDVGSSSGSYYVQALADGIITPEQNVGALRAQQVQSYNGKVLRLNPMTGEGVANNPFYQASAPGSVQSKVWALGLRNPFRMTLKPGSGNATEPGVLYIGDVGFDTWEEINAAVRPGMNFGWPLFEGLTPNPGYWNKKTANPYAPTGADGCAQAFYNFQDLITQDTPSGTASFTNPCTGQATATAIPTFVHSRPLFDWNHVGNGPSRTGIFEGGVASEINIGAPGSPISGPQFGGSSAMGGVFYPHTDFPPEYRNTCFFGDYPGGWIRSLSVDNADKPVAVRNFIDKGAIVVAMATHPTQGGLYYVNFYPSEIRKVSYNASGGGTAPVAVASADKTSGASPLTVQFVGSDSHDADGHSITYLWDFGDGTTSTAVNPTHAFPAGAPTNYKVTLTVSDDVNTGQTSLAISANNTPPQVNILSPAAGTKYPLTGQTTYTLEAAVTDQEHSSGQLSYQWQTVLHHDDHQHPEPISTSPRATTTISPLGCGTEVYYYTVSLTVTDAGGLSTTQEVTLYPDCPAATYLVNAGGNALTTARGSFAADQYYSHDSYNYSAAVPIAGTTDASLYQSERYSTNGQLRYALPLSNGQYSVVLHFAEIFWEQVGQRVFDVSLEGLKVLDNYDIVRKVGPRTATSETFLVTVTDGVLNLDLSALTEDGGVDQAKISAIEVVPAPAFRLNAGGSTLATALGIFAADQYYGHDSYNYSAAVPIAGTTDASLYQSERYSTNGQLRYALPLSNGQYSVVLHFAEIFWEQVGQRVFDVSLEGLKVLDNYDIVRKVGPRTATSETFLVTVTDGVLNLDLSALAEDGGVDQAKLSALEIIPNTGNRASASKQALAAKSGLSSVRELSVYPNPTVGHFTLRCAADRAQTATLLLTDRLGRVVQQRLVSLHTGLNLVPVEAQNVSQGLYQLSLQLSDGKRLNQKVMIQP
ncbi:malectin domain-containing carbohydrate-binding protein [Hymenobacter sp. YC55]|uniref:malectin domain-containing carbohydrate-binding protein n=1 Tax=Hymenobacter sp. YC55 TaxID=3034019 RepID=UPI0023F755D7|nr:malectin domain-containing carbohydrate-binding protein [Hymenobacter sp. YC55]MDF7811563.1 malectin domain-containing carbohydrate-binding protein [Hymenobacter sp. YC55]